MRATFISSHQGKKKSYKSMIRFLSYKHYGSKTNTHYVSKIIITKKWNDPSSATIQVYLPDGIITQKWASYDIAVGYFKTRFTDKNVILELSHFSIYQ